MSTTFVNFSEIIETYINGNRKEALRRIEESGWYDFVSELEDCPVISTEKKLEMLITLIRLKNR